MNEEILNALLLDRTTGKNILWANAEFGAKEITAAQVDSIVPRHEKIRETQKQRTRDRAEIFTPPEICALQNDLIDAAWLRNIVASWLKENYKLDENSPIDKPIIDANFEKIAAAWFGQNKISSPPEKPADTIVAAWLAENETLWQSYVTSPRLEITCGEAPYLVSRYNAVTGEAIQLDKRVGLLDRKFQLINMETSNLKDWSELALRAVESVYGYEFQGDNLFLARRNVFDTVVENFAAKFDCKPPENFWLAVATIISCNLWQMDGKTNAIPYYEPPPEKPKSRRKENPNQGNLGEGFDSKTEREPENVYCRIMDWKTGKKIKFKSLLEKNNHENFL